MAKAQKSDESLDMYKIRPAETDEARQNQMIALAERTAERWMLEDRAPASVVNHYLALGTEKAKLERKQLEADIKLKMAKVEAIEQTKRIEELYNNAIEAMKLYTGSSGDYD